MTTYKKTLTAFSEELLQTVESRYDLVLYFLDNYVRCETDPKYSNQSAFRNMVASRIPVNHLQKIILSDAGKVLHLNP